MRAALKRGPAPLLVAELAAVAVALFGLARVLSNILVAPVYPVSGIQLPLVRGSQLAISLLMLVGTLQLTRRLNGNARVGARIAAASAGLVLAYQLLTMCQILARD